MNEVLVEFMRASRLPLGARKQPLFLRFTIPFIILQHSVSSLSQMTDYSCDGFSVTFMFVGSVIRAHHMVLRPFVAALMSSADTCLLSQKVQTIAISSVSNQMLPLDTLVKQDIIAESKSKPRSTN